MDKKAIIEELSSIFNLIKSCFDKSGVERKIQADPKNLVKNWGVEFIKSLGEELVVQLKKEKNEKTREKLEEEFKKYFIFEDDLATTEIPNVRTFVEKQKLKQGTTFKQDLYTIAKKIVSGNPSRGREDDVTTTNTLLADLLTGLQLDRSEGDSLGTKKTTAKKYVEGIISNPSKTHNFEGFVVQTIQQDLKAALKEQFKTQNLEVEISPDEIRKQPEKELSTDSEDELPNVTKVKNEEESEEDKDLEGIEDLEFNSKEMKELSKYMSYDGFKIIPDIRDRFKSYAKNKLLLKSDAKVLELKLLESPASLTSEFIKELDLTVSEQDFLDTEVKVSEVPIKLFEMSENDTKLKEFELIKKYRSDAEKAKTKHFEDPGITPKSKPEENSEKDLQKLKEHSKELENIDSENFEKDFAKNWAEFEKSIKNDAEELDNYNKESEKFKLEREELKKENKKHDELRFFKDWKKKYNVKYENLKDLEDSAKNLKLDATDLAGHKNYLVKYKNELAEHQLKQEESSLNKKLDAEALLKWEKDYLKKYLKEKESLKHKELLQNKDLTQETKSRPNPTLKKVDIISELLKKIFRDKKGDVVNRVQTELESKFKSVFKEKKESPSDEDAPEFRMDPQDDPETVQFKKMMRQPENTTFIIDKYYYLTRSKNTWQLYQRGPIQRAEDRDKYKGGLNDSLIARLLGISSEAVHRAVERLALAFVKFIQKEDSPRLQKEILSKYPNISAPLKEKLQKAFENKMAKVSYVSETSSLTKIANYLECLIDKID